MGSGPVRRSAAVWTAALGALTLAVFVHTVSRYAFLGDDAFISFRYARHLIEGHGLVYNPGEHVEGYTNFLWVLLLAAGMKLGLAPEPLSQALGIASGLAILALVAWLGARRGLGQDPLGWRDPLIWVAPLALATNRTFAAWSTGGLETQLFSLLVLGAAVRFAAEREQAARWPWISALLFALAALTRPEGLLFFGLAGLLFAADVLWLRRRSLRSLLVWAGAFVPLVGGHLLWRLSYYGHPLPNTFYAKVSGFWPEQGWAFFGLFLEEHPLAAFAPLLVLPFLWRRSFLCVVFGANLVFYLAYLFYVGGDRFEFRFMTVALPPLFFLLQEGLRRAVAVLARVTPAWLPRATARAVGIGVGLLLVVAADRPNHLERRSWIRHGVASLEATRRYAERRTEEGLFLRSLVEAGYLTGGEWIATGGAGAMPYYSRFPVLDFRGLNDSTIAHQPVEGRGLIGHEKSASLEYLRARGIVIYDVFNRIVQSPGSPPCTARMARRDFYTGPVRCVKVGDRHLVFATTLDEPAFRRAFSRFEILY